MPSRIPEKFEQLVEDTQVSLRFYIRSLGVDSAWVDDIAQETFLLLLKKWQELSTHDRPDLWLRSTAKNLVRNELRKTSRRPHLINRYLTTLLLDHDEHQMPSEQMQQKERKDALRICLEKLPGRTREILHQRYTEDRNSEEIGRSFAMNSAAIRRLLFRTRAALADCIKAEQSTTQIPP